MAFEVEDVHDAFPYWLVGHGLSERGRSAVLRLNCLAQLYSVRLFQIAHALTANFRWRPSFSPRDLFCQFVRRACKLGHTANLGGLGGRSERGA